MYILYVVILAVGLASVILGSYVYLTYLVVALYALIMPTFCTGAYKIGVLLKESSGLSSLLRQIQITSLSVVFFLTLFVASSIAYGVTGGAKAATPYNAVADNISIVIWVSAPLTMMAILRYSAVAVIHKARGSSTAASTSGRAAGGVKMGEDGGRVAPMTKAMSNPPSMSSQVSNVVP